MVKYYLVAKLGRVKKLKSINQVAEHRKEGYEFAGTVYGEKLNIKLI